MSSWLYLASNQYASAQATYNLAQSGFIWRSYYADRQPAQAIPHVGSLAVGDTLYLGYRQAGQIQLLGRFRIGHPDNPLTQSAVFCCAPPELTNQLQQHGYSPDPILGQHVGIFVQEIEPVDETIPPIPNNRLAIVPLTDDSVARPVASESVFQPSRAPIETPPAVSESEEVHVGIDVGGRIDKGFDLCFLTFSKGCLQGIAFEPCPYPCALPATAELRTTVAAGDFATLARLTYPAARGIAAELWARVRKWSPRGAFIDSPSGFSRNQHGHGRATEKVAYRGVWFQCTPSVAINRQHRGDWNWLVYGMVAYMAFIHSGDQFEETDWRHSLENGLYSQARGLQGRHLRECFPTATVAVLREDPARCDRVQQLLEPHQHLQEVVAVQGYLQHGVFAVKQQHPLYDRADALVAGLSSLPVALPRVFREVERTPRGQVRWRGNDGDDMLEGRIAVVEYS